MGVLDRVNAAMAQSRPAPSRRGRNSGDPLSLDDWAQWFTYAGVGYPLIQTTMGGVDRERIPVTSIIALETNTAVFALVAARVQAFSQIRFQWSRFHGAVPGDLFYSKELDVLENPWPNGDTMGLLARMEIDNSIAGNAFIARTRKDRLARLRPDQVTVILGSQMDEDYPTDAPDVEIAGYFFLPRSGRGRIFMPEEVAHFMPMPDPQFQFLGMSWMTPTIREIQADTLATEHKAAFFGNAADLSVDSLLLTPTGWIRMGDVALGDRVIGSDGKPHYVSGVFPQGEKDIYEVTFSDGAKVTCSYDHLWHVQSRYDRKQGSHRVLPLKALVEGDGRYGPGHSWQGGLMYDYDDKRSVAKWSVPLVDPVEFDDPGPLPSTSPYRMGAMLGGRRYGLERRIPDIYLRASVNERVALLQGLLDAGGSVTVKQPNLVRSCCSSELLSRQLSELVGSLGGTAHTVRLDREGHRPQWQVTVKRLPEWIIPFRVAAKTARYEPPSYRAGRWRYIANVEHVGRGQTQCIRVDTPDSLYVTDGFVLTHNTPNLAIKFDPAVTIEMVKQFKALLEDEHKGAMNAYRTLYLGGGADPVTIGKDFQQLDFAVTQGHGESRLAAAAGVPASWVGFSEGLAGSSLNAGNFNAQRRRMADGTLEHLWVAAVGALQSVLTVPPGARLWFDKRGIPVLREDAGDLATIQQQQADTITQLVREGFTAESSVAAVTNNDWSLLKHSGLMSVQLQPPGAGLPDPQAPVAVPAVNGNGKGQLKDKVPGKALATTAAGNGKPKSAS